MIYLYDDFSVKPAQLKKWENLLSEQRLEKMNRYRFPKDRMLCLLSFLLLRFSLAQEFSVSEMPVFRTLKGEKPALENIDICFNLSHCDNAVVCAVDRKEIGIDIQDYTEHLLSVKQHILTKQETDVINSGNILKETARFWTLKEAYGKFYGYGLCYPFQEKDFSLIQNDTVWQKYENLNLFSMLYDGYALGVCAEHCMDLQKVTLEQLNAFAEKITGK